MVLGDRRKEKISIVETQNLENLSVENIFPMFLQTFEFLPFLNVKVFLAIRCIM